MTQVGMDMAQDGLRLLSGGRRWRGRCVDASPPAHPQPDPLVCHGRRVVLPGWACRAAAAPRLSPRPSTATTVWHSLPAAADDALSVAAATFPHDSVQAPVVWQVGPRSLWDEVEAAHAWWDGLGKPAVFDFGLSVTVGDDGTVHHTPWYQTPEHPVPAA